jgi:hypothetical protein
VQNAPIFEVAQGSGIGLVLIGTNAGLAAWWNNASHEFFHALLRCLGMGTSVFLL